MNELAEQRKIKTQIINLGLRYRDVASKCNIAPDRFYGFLNGYKKLRNDEIEEMHSTLETLEMEARRDAKV